MKKKLVILLCIALCAFTAGCKEKDSETAENHQVENQTLDENQTSNEKEDSNENDATNNESDKNEEEVSKESESSEKENSRKLTTEEREFFTEYMQENENYGFLLSEYGVITDVDLNQAIYNASVMLMEVASEDQIHVYLELTGDELETDLSAMTTEQVDLYLMKKTGHKLSDMSKEWDWIYDEKTDTYFKAVGDTNYEPFVCIDGSVCGDTYTLHMVSEWEIEKEDRSVYELIVKKNGEDYQFVSNALVTK